jgi:hypothetical protein
MEAKKKMGNKNTAERMVAAMGRIEFQEWLNRVDQLLEFTLDRKAGSFEGILWESLYEWGIKPLEAAVALVEELQAVEWQAHCESN